MAEMGIIEKNEPSRSHSHTTCTILQLDVYPQSRPCISHLCRQIVLGNLRIITMVLDCRWSLPPHRLSSRRSQTYGGVMYPITDQRKHNLTLNVGWCTVIRRFITIIIVTITIVALDCCLVDM